MALSTVGPYRVLERLGAGANGEVFLAEDTRLQRRVALKTLSGTAGGGAAELRRKLLREARAAARLNHPHIAAVYDVLESDEGVHIVMEYVKGSTLSAQVRQSPPPPMQVLDMALQLSDALAHAHGLGVIHRDLKPANIVVAPDGQAKILDFGLARLHAVDLGSTPLSSSELSIDARHTVGTPPYIPPEHLSGAPVDERGDVYSFGVTLFEALTGRRPFEATAGRGLADAILSAPTPRPRALCPDCPAGLDAIVFKAMARNPAERYASAADLRADLRRLRDGITDAPTQSRPVAAPRFGARRRIAKAAAATLAVGLALYGMLGAGRAPAASVPAPGTGAKVVAVLPLAGATDADTAAVGVGVAESMSSTLWKVPGIAVVSRSAAAKYHDRKATIDEMADDLGAAVLVDGMLGREGGRTWVSFDVIARGQKVPGWHRRYDDVSAVLAHQWEIAEAVARTVDLRVPEQRPPTTTSNEALLLYSDARHRLDRPDMPGNVDAAIAQLTSAIALDRRFALAHAALGEASWKKYQDTRDGKWAKDASASITEAMRLDRSDPSIRLSLITIYRGEGRLREAAEELEILIAERPRWAEAHRQLGLVRVGLKDHEGALAELREAARLADLFWSNHASLGRAYYDLGRYGEAAVSFGRVIELRPESPWGYSMLGSTRHAMDDPAEAARLYRLAIEKGSTAAYANLGLIDYEVGRFAAAVESYREAVKRDPRSPLLQLNLADAYAQLGRTEEAREGYRRALSLNEEVLKVSPTDTRVLARQATIEAKLGRIADATRHAAEAVARDPKNADVMYHATIVHARAGRAAEALAALEAALRNGYSRRRARTDPDLAPLRPQAAFHRLMSNEGGGAL